MRSIYNLNQDTLRFTVIMRIVYICVAVNNVLYAGVHMFTSCTNMARVVSLFLLAYTLDNTLQRCVRTPAILNNVRHVSRLSLYMIGRSGAANNVCDALLLNDIRQLK